MVKGLLTAQSDISDSLNASEILDTLRFELKPIQVEGHLPDEVEAVCLQSQTTCALLQGGGYCRSTGCCAECGSLLWGCTGACLG